MQNSLAKIKTFKAFRSKMGFWNYEKAEIDPLKLFCHWIPLRVIAWKLKAGRNKKNAFGTQRGKSLPSLRRRLVHLRQISTYAPSYVIYEGVQASSKRLYPQKTCTANAFYTAISQNNNY